MSLDFIFQRKVQAFGVKSITERKHGNILMLFSDVIFLKLFSVGRN
jgi:hypothetical protein